MPQPSKTLEYEVSGNEEMRRAGSGSVRITQPAPDTLTFVSLNLDVLCRLMIISVIGAPIARYLVRTNWWTDRRLAVAFFIAVVFCIWAALVRRLVFSFVRRRSPTMIDVSPGTLTFRHYFRSPVPQTVLNIHACVAVRQRINFRQPTRWEVRLYSFDLTGYRSFERIPSAPLLWYTDLDQAQQTADLIIDAFRGAAVDPANLT
jgi:hypothetical protein